MTSEKIPGPVDGCDEVFADEAEARVHVKEKHRDDFAPAPAQIIPPEEPPADQVQAVEKEKKEEDVLAMVPPGMLKILDERVEKIVEARIEAALEAYLPQVQEAVTGAMTRVVEAQARAAGIPIPVVGEGGVVPGSPVTPVGAALLQWITKGGGGSTDMENLAKTLTQARAISDVLNPPTIWDRVMQNAVLRSLSKAGLVTDAELKELTEKPPKG